MKVTKDSVKKMLKREWVITNGIGGYAASTMLGANTRKYHGLLVAPFNPPANRYVILSKVDESIEINGKEYVLTTNLCENYISQGYKYLTNFEKDYIPIFTYEVNGVIVKKLICMEYGKNTVTILYRVKNKDAKTILKLAPLLNYRDFHKTSTDRIFEVDQKNIGNKLKVVIDKEYMHPIYMNVTDGKYVPHQNDMFYNMYYPVEEERGFTSKENHVVPGVYEIEIFPNMEKDITFICSLEDNIEEIKAKDIIDNELRRINGILYDSNMINKRDKKSKEQDYLKFMRNYIIATDNFVVKRSSFGLTTLIAGYPWFLDWGRDSLISFEGILLIPRRYKEAREVILTCVRDIKYGLVPNGYSGYDNRPLYNSVDASLLLFEQVYKYLKYTYDDKFIKENIYVYLKSIIDAYSHKVDVDGNNIYLDEDGLISSGTKETQNTWMDAKVDNIAVTPRNGKAVEVNSLWYNALKIMEELATKYEGKKEAINYKEMAEKCKKTFEEKFYNTKKKCLFDVIGDDKIRPNQLFAISLSHPVIDPNTKIAKNIFETVTKKLLTKYGLKTLAKGEPGYVEIYKGDFKKRDLSYHQGITWPWILGLYYDALKNIIKFNEENDELSNYLEQFCEDVENTFIYEMTERSTIGSISEIYDSAKPYEANGTFAQCWSVAEIYRIILRK